MALVRIAIKMSQMEARVLRGADEHVKNHKEGTIILSLFILFIGIFQICILKIFYLPSERLGLILKLTQNS